MRRRRSSLRAARTGSAGGGDGDGDEGGRCVRTAWTGVVVVGGGGGCDAHVQWSVVARAAAAAAAAVVSRACGCVPGECRPSPPRAQESVRCVVGQTRACRAGAGGAGAGWAGRPTPRSSSRALCSRPLLLPPQLHPPLSVFRRDFLHPPSLGLSRADQSTSQKQRPLPRRRRRASPRHPPDPPHRLPLPSLPSPTRQPHHSTARPPPSTVPSPIPHPPALKPPLPARPPSA